MNFLLKKKFPITFSGGWCKSLHAHEDLSNYHHNQEIEQLCPSSKHPWCCPSAVTLPASLPSPLLATTGQAPIPTAVLCMRL